LHLDATGCVVQRMKYSNHFTYDIVRFLSEQNRYCKVYKLKLPICKRIITDVSIAIIQAILNEFND